MTNCIDAHGNTGCIMILDSWRALHTDEDGIEVDGLMAEIMMDLTRYAAVPFLP